LAGPPDVSRLCLHDALPIFRPQVCADGLERQRERGGAERVGRDLVRIVVEGERVAAEREVVVEGEALVDEEDVAGLRERLRGRRSEEHTSELQSRENLVCRL